MILASDFVDTAYNANYKFYAGVPALSFNALY